MRALAHAVASMDLLPAAMEAINTDPVKQSKTTVLSQERHALAHAESAGACVPVRIEKVSFELGRVLYFDKGVFILQA